MELTKTDMTIIMASVIAIVSMSFVFPAVGLGGSAVGADDMPEFGIEQDRFNFVGDLPDRPGTPSSGQLTWYKPYDQTFDRQDNGQWVQGDETDGLYVVTNLNTTNNDGWYFAVDNWTDNTATTGIGEINDPDPGDGAFIEVTEGGYTVEFELAEIYQPSFDANATAFVWEYEVTERPDADSNLGWIVNVPVIGDVAAASEQVAQAVLWIGSVILWGLQWIAEIGLNLLGMLFDVMSFGMSLLSWLAATYSAVVAGASSWAGVIVAVPGILIAMEFAKIVLIGISLLPTT